MSNNFTEKSADLFQQIYGSSYSIDSHSTETITDPQIILPDEKNIEVIKKSEKNRKNGDDEEDFNKLNNAITASKYEIIKKIGNIGGDKLNFPFL